MLETGQRHPVIPFPSSSQRELQEAAALIDLSLNRVYRRLTAFMALQITLVVVLGLLVLVG